MTNKNATEDKQDINQQLLVKTATTVDLLNTRLFGGDGQMGAIPFIVNQHKELAEKLDKNKQDLLDRIDKKKEETDEDIKELNDQHDKLENKMNWYAGGITALWSAAALWLGIHNKG